MCAFLFDSDKHAVWHMPRCCPPSRAHSKPYLDPLGWVSLDILAGRAGVTGPELDNSQINLLHDNAVIELKAPVDVPDSTAGGADSGGGEFETALTVVRPRQNTAAEDQSLRPVNARRAPSPIITSRRFPSA